MLKFSADLLWLQISQPTFHLNNSHFLFKKIKNYAKTTMLFNEKVISKEAAFTAQQCVRKVKFSK